MTEPLTIQWAAGFFEGEGSATIRKHIKYNRPYNYIALSVAQVYKEPLDVFCKLVGFGKVRGPYGPYQGNRQPHYQYTVNGREAIIVANLLIPYMFRKGEQVQEVLEKCKESYV